MGKLKQSYALSVIRTAVVRKLLSHSEVSKHQNIPDAEQRQLQRNEARKSDIPI